MQALREHDRRSGAVTYPPQGPLDPPSRLMRSSQNRMFAGVCGGLGRTLGIDPVLVRVVYALVTFFTAIVPGIIVYVILALVMPSDDGGVS